MECGSLQEVKAIIKSLVLSNPSETTVDSLKRDFRNTEGYAIPFRILGYASLEGFLGDISDAVQVRGYGPTAKVYFVSNKKSDHIHDMISHQKPPRGGRGKKTARPMPQKPQFRYERKSIAPPQHTGPTQKYGPPSSVCFSHSPQRALNRNVVNKCGFRNISVPFNTQAELKKPAPLIQLQSEQYDDILQKRVQSMAVSRNLAFGQQNKPTVVSKPAEVISAAPSHEVKAAAPSHELQTVTCHNVLKESIQSMAVSKNLLLKRAPISQEMCKEDEEEKTLESVFEKQVKLTTPSPCAPKPPTPKEVKVTAKENTNSEAPKRLSRVSALFQLSDSSDEQLKDIDEAVPEFAANNLVFRVDFPENVVSFGRKIPRYELPDDLEVGSIKAIFVSEIHNPFKFWFHFHKTNHELDILMNRMERFYSIFEEEDYCIPRRCIMPGQVCAAKYMGMWHRAEIVFSLVDGKAKVFFMDYGTVAQVPAKDIKFLHERFAEPPAQAVRGCLSHVKPRGLHWSPEGTKYFLKTSSELMLYAQVSEIDEVNMAIYMILCDTNGTEDVQINKMLVEKGYAIYDEAWQNYRIEKTGQRLRHLREDYPTYEMIEMGEYPSFYELTELKSKGIDYERMIDTNLFHPGKLNYHQSMRKLSFKLLTTNPFRYDIVLQMNHLI